MKRVKELVKRVVMTLVMVARLTVGMFSFNVYANPNLKYELPKSCIAYEFKGNVLLDLPHSDVYDKVRGIRDNGANYGDITEREISESITMKVKEILEKNGVRVTLTRGLDDSVSLEDRINIANKGNYDYYISLHCNASENPQANGVESFSSSAWSLSNNITKRLVSELGMNNRGIYETPYYTQYMKCKTMLYEMGFGSNQNDKYNLINKQDTYAKIIAEEIINILQN